MNIYKLALDVQDASNPNGVINSLANQVMPAIREERGYREIGTQYVKDHPALILFLDKLNSMTGLQSIGDQRSYDRITAAYTMAKALATLGPVGLDTMEQNNRVYVENLGADYRAALALADEVRS